MSNKNTCSDLSDDLPEVSGVIIKIVEEKQPKLTQKDNPRPEIRVLNVLSDEHVLNAVCILDRAREMLTNPDLYVKEVLNSEINTKEFKCK